MKTTPKVPPQGRKPITGFRCPKDLRSEVEKRASSEHRTVSNMIVSLLYAALKGQ